MKKYIVIIIIIIIIIINSLLKSYKNYTQNFSKILIKIERPHQYYINTNLIIIIIIMINKA